MMKFPKLKLILVVLLCIMVFAVFDNLDARAKIGSTLRAKFPTDPMPESPSSLHLGRGKFNPNNFINPLDIFLGETFNPSAMTGIKRLRTSPSSEFVVTNSTDSGVGSLRWAIEQANSNPGPDIIYFHTSYMTGSTIMPLSNLPPLTDDGTVIDASWNWVGDWPGGKPGVTIDGSQYYGLGLRIEGARDITIKGLEIQDFSVGVFIDTDASNNTIGEGASPFGGGRMLIHSCGTAAVFINGDDNRVIGSYIGTSNDGNLPQPNQGKGVTISDGKRNQIGGEGALESNIIGASYHGILIMGTEAISNTVIKNRIGIGSKSGNIGNTYDGVHISSGAQITGIGGLVFCHEVGLCGVYGGYGNYIRKNGRNGVCIRESGTLMIFVTSNHIDENIGNGIDIDQGALGIHLYSNTITRNAIGVKVDGENTTPHTTHIAINTNYIGTDVNSTTGLGNHKGGIYINNASNNQIWSTVIGQNSGNGVLLAESFSNRIKENWIGVDKDGMAIGNTVNGVAIVNGSSNILDQNEIANNGIPLGRAGVLIAESTSLENQLTQNSIYNNYLKGIELYLGAHNGLTPPNILSAACPMVSGDGAPANGIVEIFSDDEDEGRYYDGFSVADENGDWTYIGSFRGPNLTVTGTVITEDGPDLHYTTSEFSTPVNEVGSCSAISLPMILR